MNINFEELNKIISLAERSNIHSLEVEDGNTRIHIVCQSPLHIDSVDSNDNQNFKQAQSLQNTSANDHSSFEEIIEPDNPNTEFNTPKQVDNSLTIVAPMMGTFYLRPEPSAEVFIKNGDTVEAGDTLCIIEAMKIMHEVKADKAGKVKQILIEEGEVIEFDQPLIELNPL